MTIMTDLALNMEDIDAFLDLESPYMYAEDYLDTATSSESTSPIMSSVSEHSTPPANAPPQPDGAPAGGRTAAFVS